MRSSAESILVRGTSVEGSVAPTHIVRSDLSVHAIVYLAGAMALAMAVGLPASARPWAAVLGAAALAVTLEFGARSLPVVVRRLGQVAGAAIAALALTKMFDAGWVAAGAGVAAVGAAAVWYLRRPVTETSPWVTGLHTAVSALVLMAMPIVALVAMDRTGWLGHDLGPAAVVLAVVGLVQAASSHFTPPTWASLAALLGSRHAIVGAVLAGFMAAGAATDSRWPFPVCAGLMALTALVTAPAHRSEIVSGLGIAAAIIALVEGAAVLGWIDWLAGSGPLVLGIIGAALAALAFDLLHGGHRHHHS